MSRPPGWEREGRAYLCDMGGPRLSRPPGWEREGRACRGRLVGVRLWNADASHTQFWQRPMWLRRPEYRATPQSVFAKVQGREPARRREGVVGADVLGRLRVRGVPAGAFAYTARRGRRALPCATREGRACRGRLVGVRLWNADASHTQFWQRPMWLRRPEYRATPQSVFAKVQGREPARRRERGRGGRPRPPAATAVTRAALPHPLRARKNAVQIFEQSAGRRFVK